MPSPRVLLTIDYESWFALTRRYDQLAGSEQRRDLDGGFVLRALDPILEMLGNAKASLYLVGEIADWYPEIPQKIAAAGHELGFHCQIHRSLVNLVELERDLAASTAWRKQYNVRGYRAPMVGIDESAYALLARHGFTYSSSIYAPAGTLLQKGGLWELPVSTWPLLGQPKMIRAPRKFTFNLLAHGEIPYGSSLVTGLMPQINLKIIEREIRAGRSPVIFLHPYELVRPEAFLRRLGRDVAAHPLLYPFTLNKANFLKTLLKNFPVSSLISYLDEATHA